jgi:polyisoprenoid-binding protein YceI
MRTPTSLLAVSSIAVAALLAPLSGAAAQAAATARLVPAQSEIVFVSKQMGVPVEGRFKKFDAQVTLDPAKPEAGQVALRIDLGSATLGVPETDAELQKPEWFNTATFPQATFQSRSIKPLGGGKFLVDGQLTIKGNSRAVQVPVALSASGDTRTATGAFAIKRLEYKIGAGEWGDTSMVADEVQVKFKLALAGLGAP